jgi:hypothetical protein
MIRKDKQNLTKKALSNHSAQRRSKSLSSSYSFVITCIVLAIIASMINIDHIKWLYQLILSYLDESEAERASDSTGKILASKIVDKYPPALKINLTTTTVQEITWGKDIYNFHEVLRYDYPVLIKGYPKIFDNDDWDLLRLVRQHPQQNFLHETRWQINEATFILGTERDRGGMLGSKRDRPLHYVNISLDQFLETALDNTTYFYWTGELSTIAEATGLTKNMSAKAWQPFRIVDRGLEASIHLDKDHELWKPMLWLSHPGIVSQTHYDTQHNLFMQAFGIKRFLLFDPSSALYIYPNIHRSYRQSQVILSEDDILAKYPLINELKAQEAILKPGDLLYIPPYHYHRVESLSLSMSMSVLSPSSIEARLAEAFWRQVPFSKFQDKTLYRTTVVRLYLELILKQSSYLNQTIQSFAQVLYKSRFEPLYGQLNTSPSKDLCGKVSDDDLDFHEKLTSTWSLFESSAKEIASILDLLSSDMKSSSIALTFMQDYSEQIIRWAVGPTKVADYLKHC